ncbi:hypothetical protein O9X94_23450 [Agrobacterium leguminum]|uniref:Restriction endonuclease n=1 Tax=Agrobacterium leguminum TaxID=2792015 RepID=A0A9X3QVZ7_9HYPH|nr:MULTISPECIES: BglII/BstYI family type II restriction endonuclease [Agrobacterium]MCZ7912293.1 hypothetical protein [Agrobacterium leguminum]RRN73482.1 restriction endonuclease [Agrobacterium deltaense]
MKLASTYSHHNGRHVWEDKELFDWVTDIFAAPAVKIERRCTPNIREHVETELLNDGWALNVSLDQGLGLKVLALKEDLAFHIQTGNMSRAPYDLLKLQYLFEIHRIKGAAFALPTKEAARVIGDNIAHAERVVRELELFDRVITVPILVIAFE